MTDCEAVSLFNFGKKSSRKQAFWKWFSSNQQNYTILEGQPDVDRLINEVGDQLRRVDSRLCCEFSANKAPAEFIISADGDETAFPLVRGLISSAPEISGWEIIAFRQRGGAECTIGMGDIELGPAQMWFRLEGDGDRVGIHLYFGGIELNDEVVGAAFILLDNALGECDMETKVGFIERYQLKPEDDVSQLKPFEKLPEAFDAFYAMTHKRRRRAFSSAAFFIFCGNPYRPRPAEVRISSWMLLGTGA